jgi:hypothetical protein
LNSSTQELQSPQIVFGPLRLNLDHGFQGFDFEGITGAVEGDC